MNPPPVICIMGPTASGKTALAMKLVDQLNGEIISVDSAMVYRDMSIGTAKPEEDILKKYPHHLIDIRDPAQAYSAADFRHDAIKLIDDIYARKKRPILVGGTMLYYQVLQKGISELPSADQTIRDKLGAQAKEFGWEKLHARLQKCDPVAAARIKPNDPQRIMRALEVFELTGTSMTQLWEDSEKAPPPYEFINIGLIPTERSRLHLLIEQRFDEMLKMGFLEEVKALQARGDLTADDPAIRCVGYRQAWSYLLGEIDHKTMRERAIIATRQLAKRQLTWLRSWPELNCIDCFAEDVLQQALNKCGAS